MAFLNKLSNLSQDESIHSLSKNLKQIGLDINGSANESLSTVSINKTGDVIAISSSTANSSNGLVRVFYWNGSSWTQRGSNFNGSNSNQYGKSIALNADGSVIVIGAPADSTTGTARGKIEVYSWNGSAWVERLDLNNQRMYGSSNNANFGSSVAINSLGSKIVVGSPNESAGGLTGNGTVSIYTLIITNLYVKDDTVINGLQNNSHAGQSVSINSAGDIIVIGEPDYASGLGCVRIYYELRNGISQIYNRSWTQLGSTINEPAGIANAKFGYSTSINAAGDRIIIGAYGANYFSTYQNASGWQTLGNRVSKSSGSFGHSVDMNGLGDIVIVSQPNFSYSSSITLSGRIDIYKYYDDSLSWKLNSSIYGKKSNDSLGGNNHGVSIDDEGSKFAISSSGSDDNGNNSGKIQVYNNVYEIYGFVHFPFKSLSYPFGDSSSNAYAAASTPDGSIIILWSAGRFAYISRDKGSTWQFFTELSASTFVNFLATDTAISPDGSVIAAASNFSALAISTNYGVSFTARNISSSWNSIAMSSNGQFMTAGSSLNLYTSTNSGATWTVRANDQTRRWSSVAMSSDGAIQAAIGGSTSNYNSTIWISTNYGYNWTEKTSLSGGLTGTKLWRKIAMSSNGQFMTAISWNDSPYVSRDSGATWWKVARDYTGGETPTNFTNVDMDLTMSSDGKFQVIAAVDETSFVLISKDYGFTWTRTNISYSGKSIAVTDDKKTIVIASAPNGPIYSSSVYQRLR